MIELCYKAASIESQSFINLVTNELVNFTICLSFTKFVSDISRSKCAISALISPLVQILRGMVIFSFLNCYTKSCPLKGIEIYNLIGFNTIGLFLIYFEEETVKMDPTVAFHGSFTLLGF